MRKFLIIFVVFVVLIGAMVGDYFLGNIIFQKPNNSQTSQIEEIKNDNSDIIINDKETFEEVDFFSLSAGLYDVDGILIMSWNELIDNNFIEVGENLNGDLYIICSAPFKKIKGVLVVQNGITNIYQGFESSYGLIEIILPNSVVQIDTQTFVNCVNLRKITIPSGVNEIEYGLFEDCYGLTSVTLLGNELKVGSRNLFKGCYNLSAIYVNADLVEEYKTAEYWSEYADLFVGVE